ncbi:hypothetical protein N234_31705 [Ralstonia pickettii DTP0602]|nr:hypothetical protein N234_31705 [Ralstonia pickettii DTP0602]
MKTIRNFFALGVALILAACVDHQAAPAPAAAAGQAGQGAPVVVQQQSETSWMPALLGGLAGYMLGSSGSRQAAQPAQVVGHHYVQPSPRYQARAASPVPAPAAASAPAKAAGAPIGPLPKVVPMTPPAAKPFAYGAPPAPQPKVTYGSGFSTPKASAAPAPRYSALSYTSRPGAYSGRR